MPPKLNTTEGTDTAPDEASPLAPSVQLTEQQRIQNRLAIDSKATDLKKARAGVLIKTLQGRDDFEKKSLDRAPFETWAADQKSKLDRAKSPVAGYRDSLQKAAPANQADIDTALATVDGAIDVLTKKKEAAEATLEAANKDVDEKKRLLTKALEESVAAQQPLTAVESSAKQLDDAAKRANASLEKKDYADAYVALAAADKAAAVVFPNQAELQAQIRTAWNKVNEAQVAFDAATDTAKAASDEIADLEAKRKDKVAKRDEDARVLIRSKLLPVPPSPQPAAK